MTQERTRITAYASAPVRLLFRNPIYPPTVLGLFSKEPHLFLRSYVRGDRSTRTRGTNFDKKLMSSSLEVCHSPLCRGGPEKLAVEESDGIIFFAAWCMCFGGALELP